MRPRSTTLRRRAVGRAVTRDERIRVAFVESRSDVERILRELGGAQHGVCRRWQLLARGVAARTIDRMIERGRLVVLHPGVYQIGPLAMPRGGEAFAVLACGAGCRISHWNAGALHRLIEREHNSNRVEVSVPRNRRPDLPGIRIHRARDLRPDEVTTVEGIPVTTPARTLLDIGETMSAREVEQAFAKALRMKLVTVAEMEAMVARHPRHRGAPVLRRLLDAERDPAFTRSQAEERLLEIVREARLPEPAVNARVMHFEVDFLWTVSRLIAEVDGYAYHGGVRSFVADRRRDAELTAAGYRVLRFTWADLTGGRMATAARLGQALVR